MTKQELYDRGISFSGEPDIPPPRFPSFNWFRYMWWSFMCGWRKSR